MIFEGPPVDMSIKYSNVLKIMYVSTFFANLLPTCLIVGIIALLLVYWSDKYLLLRV